MAVPLIILTLTLYSLYFGQPSLSPIHLGVLNLKIDEIGEYVGGGGGILISSN